MFDLGSAPPTQLLFLMAIPLGAAVLLAGFIAFSFINRSKKAKMKHGISEASSISRLDAMLTGDSAATTPLKAAPEGTAAPPTAVSQPAVLTKPEPAVASVSNDLQLNMDILSDTSAKTTPNRKVPLMNSLPEQPTHQDQPQGHPPPAEPVELMRFLRDAETGQLIIQIGPHRYTKLADITNKQIGQFILKMAAQLLAFTNGMIITEIGVKSVFTPKVGPTPQPAVVAPERSAPEPPLSFPVQSPPAEPAQPQSGDPLVPPPSVEAAAAFQAMQAQAAVRPAPPSPEPLPVPARGGLLGRAAPVPAPTPSALPGLNLAREINEIVQMRLTYSSLSSTHRIDVRSSPDGGIQILVNGQLYGSPDEISEPEVKTLIKDSIRQWERT